jgi:hypothetical protein
LAPGYELTGCIGTLCPTCAGTSLVLLILGFGVRLKALGTKTPSHNAHNAPSQRLKRLNGCSGWGSESG